MKKIISKLCFFIPSVFIFSYGSAADLANIKYSIKNNVWSKNNGVANVTIQKLFIDKFYSSENARKKINSFLDDYYNKFYLSSKKCGAAAQGHPWGYDLKFEKYIASQEFFIVLFKSSTVCAGSPDMEKEAEIFLANSGEKISQLGFIKMIAPDFYKGFSVGATGLININSETSEKLIEDSQDILKDKFDESCSFFLKTTSYRVWSQKNLLVLYPEFIQPESYCQKEYYIKID